MHVKTNESEQDALQPATSFSDSIHFPFIRTVGALKTLSLALTQSQPLTMNDTTKRSILRSIHMVFALPIVGYIYGPPSETVQYLPYFRYIYFPVVVLSGLWMWKGHVVRRLFARRPDERNV